MVDYVYYVEEGKEGARRLRKYTRLNIHVFEYTLVWRFKSPLRRISYIYKITHNRLIFKALFDFDIGRFVKLLISRRLTPI